MNIFTIGVYNSNEQDFFNKLLEAKVNIFVDVRKRRGVRGKKYSFVNSVYLQQELSHKKIKYIYIKDLAPTEDIRYIQKKIDAKSNILKTNRVRLSDEFKEKYVKLVDNFDFTSFFNSIMDTDNIVFFCVEENHEACHRSLITKHISTKYGGEIIHL